MTQPTSRERARPDFPAVVHTYTDLLRLLRDEGPRSVQALAEKTQRVPSNIRRDLHKLISADVVTTSGDTESMVVALTDKGRQWVVGRDVADGLASPPSAEAAPTRWPIDKFRPNPANRAIDPVTIPEMAQAIVAAGDVLQEIHATPADANGVRMILDGERRWRGASLLAEQTNLDGLAIAQGLRFIEREATEAEQLQIIIITATQRQDLSPWEDAKLLLRYAELTGKSASDVARDMGRAGEGRSGLRDVQTKLKVAREATPEAIAEYERNGSWDQLRNSVSTPKPQDRLPPHLELAQSLAASGPAVMAPARSGTLAERLIPEGIDPASIETFTLPNAKPGWKGRPDAEIDIGRVIETGLWIAAAEFQGPTGGFGEPFSICPANPDRHETREAAIAAAVARIRADDRTQGDKRLQGWLDGLAAAAQTIAAFAASSAGDEAVDPEAARWTAGGFVEADRKTFVGQLGQPGASLTTYRCDRPFDAPLYRCRAEILPPDGDPVVSTPIPGCTSRIGAIQLATEDLLHADRNAPRAIIEWLDRMTGEHVVGGKNCYNAARAGERRVSLGWVSRPSNSGGGSRSTTTDVEQAAETETPATPPTPATDPAVASLQTHEAVRRVLNERMRQVEAERFTREGDDDQNGDGELAHAAAAYAAASAGDPDAALWWPGGWDPQMFKPTGTIRDLEKAGALIVAEIERRVRQGEAA